LLSQQLNQQGIGFGNDKEIDWYIQILKSNNLTDSLITRFKLSGSFKVNSNNLKEKSKLFKLIESRIIVEKTRYGAVSIKVLDNDSKRAADMANDLVDIGEIIKRKLLYNNRREALNYIQSLYEQKSAEVIVLENKLDSLEKKYQTTQLRNNLLFEKIQSLYKLEFQELISRKDIFEREKTSFDTPLPKTYIVSNAIPTHKPVWPKRWLWSIAAGGIYFFLLIVIEIIKSDLSKKQI
jgi:hypothetical protein